MATCGKYERRRVKRLQIGPPAEPSVVRELTQQRAERDDRTVQSGVLIEDGTMRADGNHAQVNLPARLSTSIASSDSRKA
jgi:hypothetical protein